MWYNTIFQIVTKLENSNCDFTQKLKLWQNSKTDIVKKKIKNISSDKTKKNDSEEEEERKKKLLKKQIFWPKDLLVITNWHLDNGWDLLGAPFCDHAMFFGEV